MSDENSDVEGLSNSIALGETLDLLTFTLNDNQYAASIKDVRQVDYLKRITPIPRTPDFIVGIFNGRGHLTTVIDLHALLTTQQDSLAGFFQGITLGVITVLNLQALLEEERLMVQENI